jgi:predicted O-methyltransferase YrrM
MGFRETLRRVPLLRRLVLAVRPLALNLRYRLTPSADYPTACATGVPNREAVELARTTGARVIAEIGVYKGLTSEEYARLAGAGGELHLFDFQERVDEVAGRLRRLGFDNVVAHGNSHKSLDSYNWSLARLLERHHEPVFDFVMIDGAHTWHHDGFAFVLCDRLLKPGGHVYFDDYDWSLAASPYLNPVSFPNTRRMFTEEQIPARQVQLIVDLLVRRDPRYVEVIPNAAFRKERD